MMNHLESTRKSIDAANSQVQNLLDLAGIPDGHALEAQVDTAMAALYNSLEAVAKNGKTAANLNDEGPLVFPSPDEDMRDWKTSDQRLANELIPHSGRLAEIQTDYRLILAPKNIRGRRVISSREYAEALETAIYVEPIPAPMDDEVEGALPDFTPSS